MTPPFKLMPERDHSKELTLEGSRVHEGQGFSNTKDFCRFDDELLKEAKSQINPLNFRAKMALGKLKLPLNAEDALKEVNKLEGKISEKALTNLRYLCSVSESGYKPYIEHTTKNGVLDDSIKSKFVRPIVTRTTKVDPQKSEKLKNIVADCTQVLEATQANVRTLRDKTVQMGQTVQMNTKAKV